MGDRTIRFHEMSDECIVRYIRDPTPPSRNNQRRVFEVLHLEPSNTQPFLILPNVDISVAGTVESSNLFLRIPYLQTKGCRIKDCGKAFVTGKGFRW